jgi:hypothetical protein
MENAVRGFIVKHYGNYEALANELGITVATVGTWTKRRPRGILKYAPEITGDEKKGITADELIEAVNLQLTRNG